MTLAAPSEAKGGEGAPDGFTRKRRRRRRHDRIFHLFRSPPAPHSHTYAVKKRSNNNNNISAKLTPLGQKGEKLLLLSPRPLSVWGADCSRSLNLGSRVIPLLRTVGPFFLPLSVFCDLSTFPTTTTVPVGSGEPTENPALAC